jgi:uncharacterized protein (TIGR04255 family)
MGTYVPFAGKNAIAEMSIGIIFQSALDSSIGEKFTVVRDELVADFSKFEPIQQFVFNFGGSPQFPPMLPSGPVPQNPSGIAFTKTRGDGNIARIFRILNNSISFHIMEYTSWSEAKSLALDYTNRSLTKLATIDKNPATALIVRYLDRFTFDGDPNTANAKMLLRPGTDLVAARIFESGSQWHCNSGWYQALVNQEVALNNLNLASALIQNVFGVVIEHTNLYTLPKPCNSLVELTHGADGRPSLEEILDLQHKVNVGVLRKLLIPDILKTIGLEG